MKEATKADHLPLPANVAMCIARHAQDRAVSKRRLIRDIVTAWCAVVTDWDHPRFKDSLIPIEPVQMPLDIWPGYIDSLIVFTPPDLDAPAIPGNKL